MKFLKDQITKNDSEMLRLKQSLEEKLHGDWYEVLKAWEESGRSLTKSMVVKNKVYFFQLVPFSHISGRRKD
jgi:hypothetical protein